MMTNPPDDRNAEPSGDLTPPSLMWAMKKIAERDGVSRQAVHKATHKFVNDGAITGIERNPRGHITAVNIVEYDRARGTSADPAKMQGSATKKILDEDGGQQPAGKMPSDYTRAITGKALYETELRKIELHERQGLLRPLAEIEAGVDLCGETIIAAIERVKFRHDDLATAVANEGLRGSQAFLKQFIFELRSAVADALALIVQRESQQSTTATTDLSIDASATPDDAGITSRES